MTMAATKVFAIPELLEMILLQVPPRSLLVSAQRVSKQWSEAIKASAKLQQSLCFKQRPADSSVVNEANPFLDNLLKEIFTMDWKDLNFHTWIEPPYGEPHNTEFVPEHFNLQVDTNFWPGPNPCRREQSWHKMYFTSIPCEVHVVYDDPGFDWRFDVSEPGSTISEVIDSVWEGSMSSGCLW